MIKKFKHRFRLVKRFICKYLGHKYKFICSLGYESGVKKCYVCERCGVKHKKGELYCDRNN